MNRWAKIQMAIAAAGVLGFAAVGAHGLATGGDPDLLPLHTQSALLATLLIVLSQSWVAIYALVSARLLEAREAGPRRRLLAAAGLALAAVVGNFLVGGRLFTTHAPGWIHGVAAGSALAILILALVVEAIELGRHQRAAEALEQEERGARRVLDSARS
jgi:hypothetical protein